MNKKDDWTRESILLKDVLSGYFDKDSVIPIKEEELNTEEYNLLPAPGLTNAWMVGKKYYPDGRLAFFPRNLDDEIGYRYLDKSGSVVDVKYYGDWYLRIF